MQRVVIIFILTLFVFSCERPEKPIKPFDRGAVTTQSVTLGSNYENQIFYSLDSGKIVRSVNRMDWDLAFDCSEKHILLTNNGRGIYVAPTGKNLLSEVNDTAGLKFYWGQPSLNPDSLAFGKWWENSPRVFVINMGNDLNGLPLGFMKCIPQLDGLNLKLTWSKLETNNPKTLTLIKNKELNFVYASLLKETIVDIEPPKQTWDLLFTQYIKLLFDPPYPATRHYEVVGVLQNTSRIETGFDFSTPFAEINFDKIPSALYKLRDAIGFDWKWFDLPSNSYTVNPGMNYILKTSQGFFYKLHFLDFYDDKGVKGTPKFEFQKI